VGVSHLQLRELPPGSVVARSSSSVYKEGQMGGEQLLRAERAPTGDGAQEGQESALCDITSTLS
jgi:hypothetical protein